MEKRVIFATVLSMMVILLWWFWMPPQKPQLIPSSTPQLETDSRNNKQPVPTMSESQAARPAHQYQEKNITIETDSAKIVFNSLGAKIKNWYIKEGKDGETLTDLVLQPIDDSYMPQNFACFSETNFDIDKVTSNSITFSVTVDKIKILKEYKLSSTNNLHKLILKLTNLTDKYRDFKLNLTLGTGLGGSDTGKRKAENSVTKAIGLPKQNNVQRKTKLTKFKTGQFNFVDYRWIGIENRYFFVTLINNDDNFDNVNIKQVGSEKLYSVDFTSKLNLKPYEETTFSSDFYFGPKDYTKLQKIGHELEKAVNFGFFSPLAKLAFYTLKFFYSLTGNYGVSIIILTIIMQILFSPLTVKSFKATTAMKTIQPKIKELQTKYKNDPKRLNTETMYLYKSQKVNPLGGCLPMLLQLPIFWALFTTLQNTYVLRKAPFILWITDLTSPDLLFNIPIPPTNIPIRILPLLMGIAMFIQQKSSGTTLDPSQKMFVYLMPIIFTVIFWNFASGLVLYWLVNSILTMLIQSVITSKTNKTRYAKNICSQEITQK